MPYRVDASKIRSPASARRPPASSRCGLLTVFLVTLLNGLSNGQRYGWLSDPILSDFAFALVTGIGFIAWELFTPTLMLNLKLFKNRAYTGASILAFIFGAGNYGSTYLIPLFAQTIQGYTPTRSGLLLMPAGLVLAMVFPIAGRLTDQTPAYAPVMFGLAVFALSSFLMTGVDTDTSFWLFAWWIILGRIGLGFIMPSLKAGALQALPIALLGQGSGAINFVRQLGGAFGVNFLSITLERRSQFYVDSFTAAQHAANSAATDMLGAVTGRGTRRDPRGWSDELSRSSHLHAGQYVGVSRQFLYRQRDLRHRHSASLYDAPKARAPGDRNKREIAQTGGKDLAKRALWTFPNEASKRLCRITALTQTRRPILTQG